MVFYAAFSSISVIYGDSSHYLSLSWVSPVLGWALNCLAQGHSHEKTQRIQCSSNPGPLDYESNTLPRSHARPDQTEGVENTVEEEKLLVSSTLSFFYCVFKTYNADTYKPGFLWERINSLPKDRIFNSSIWLSHRFQHYFSHITAPGHKFKYSLDCISTTLGLRRDTVTKNPLVPIRIEPVLDHESNTLPLSHAKPRQNC